MNVRTAPATVSGLHVYPDASGAPAVVRVGSLVYAANFIGGEPRLALIGGRPSRVEATIGSDRAHRAYRHALEASTDAAWIAANIALYA